MKQQYRNTAEKGIITEFDPYAQPQGSVADMLNFRIVHMTGNRYKIITAKGTIYSFSLNPNYRILGSWDCGNYTIIHSTNSSTSTESNGEIGILEFSAPNYVYTPLYNHQDLGFSLANYIQIRIHKNNNKDHQAYWWDNNKPPRMLNIKNPSLYELYTSISVLVDQVKYMVVSGQAEYPAASGDFYGPNEALGTVFLVATPDLSFADPNATSPRVVVYEPTVEMVDIIPIVTSISNVNFVERITPGNLKNGMWFYFVQYEYNNEVRTAWSTGTTGIHLTEDPVTVDDWMAFAEYQGMGGQTGIPNDFDQNTGCGIRLRIDNIDDKYTKLRVAAVRATDYRIITEPVVIAEVIITPGTTSVDVDHTSDRGILAMSSAEIIAYTLGILKNRTGDIGKGYLMLGNITTRYQYNWTPSVDAILSPITKDMLHDTVDADVTSTVPLHPDFDTGAWSGSDHRPLFGHLINSDKVYAGVWYQVTGGTIEAPAGTVHADGDVFMYDGLGPDEYFASIVNPMGSPVVKAVIIINLYGTEKKYIPFEDWYDQKGMAVNHNLRGRFRTETYRIGIMPYDNWQIPYDVSHLGDIQMPGMYDLVDNTTDPDNPVSTAATLIRNQTWPFLTTDGKVLHFLQSLGIRIDAINFNTLIQSINEINDTSFVLTDLPTIFKGFSIVCAPRDEQIIAQGIVYPTFFWSDFVNGTLKAAPMGCDSLVGTSTYAGLPLDGLLKMMDDIAIVPGDPTTFIRVPNTYELLAPDFLMQFNNDQPALLEGDLIRVIAHVADTMRNLDEYGTRHTKPFHIYSKFTQYTDDEADGMVALQSEAKIKISKCQTIGERDSTIVDVNGTDQIYLNYAMVYDRLTPYMRIGLGGKKMLLVTEADESGADPIWINGLSYYGAATYDTPDNPHILDGANKCIVNIIRPKNNLYGGSSQSALEATIYMPTGHFQLFDDDFMAHVLSGAGKSVGEANNIEVYGGDCYIGLFDFMRVIQYGAEADQITPLANYGLPGPIATHTDAFKYSHAVLFPVETKINLGLREGRTPSKDRSIGTADLGGTPEGNPEGISFGVGTYDNAETLRYNEAYSTEFIFALYPAAKQLNFYNNNFPKRYIWSKETTADDLINSLRQFSQANKKDVNGAHGAIINMRTRLDRMYYWQEYGAGYIGIDERSMVPNSLGQLITMGAGNVGERYDQLDETYGLQHQSAFTDIPDGFTWFDYKRKAWCVMSFNGQIVRLDVINPNQSLLSNMEEVNLPFDFPMLGTGFLMSYNPRLDEILLSIIPGEFFFDTDNPDAKKYYSIGYNLTEKIFTCRITNAPPTFVNFNNRLFSQRDDIYENQGIDQLAVATAYAVGAKALNGDDVLRCKVAHTTAGSLPIYVALNWDIIGKVSDVHLNDHGKPAEFYNVTQQSHMKFVVNPIPTGDEPFVFYNFKFNGMDENFFRTLRVKNSYQDNQDDDLDVTANAEYEFRDRKWISNVPLNTDEVRMVDGFLELILTGDNRTVTNGVRNPLVNNEKPISLMSITTELKKEY